MGQHFGGQLLEGSSHVSALEKRRRAGLVAPKLTEAERQQIVVEWNRTDLEFPRDKCIHQLFEEQVERTPEAEAIEFEGISLTYRELNQRANRVAQHLRTLDVGPDVLVGLCVPRSLEMVAAMLGILKAGGAYLPLAPTSPGHRLLFCLEESQARVMIAEASFFKQFSGPKTLCCVALEHFADLPACDNLEAVGSSADLAYVMYTSGSTGTPKGVAIEHRNVVSFLHWVRASFDDEELSGVLASTAISFDLSVFEIFGALSWGGRALLVRDIFDWGAAFDSAKIRLVNTVPSLMAALLKTSKIPAQARTVNLAGEALPTTLVDAIYSLWGVRRVNDLYGPTETTTYSTWTTRKTGEPATIGRPLANTQVYILNEDMEPVAAGVAGEIYIGGGGVARGYLNRPDLTAEKFVSNPFTPATDARLYRTGDLARWQADGNIEYIGRADQQIKIRGFRIELGEIEICLRGQANVREAVVVRREDVPGDQRLVAYLVPHGSGKPDDATLRGRLGDHLPEYMVPSSFVWLAQMPLTPNGKIDRQALPAPQIKGANTDASSLPINLLEGELIHIWRRLFQRTDIGRQDNFFSLGGHSLLATRLAAEIDKLLSCSVPIATFFQSPTIELLARRLADEKWIPPWSSLVPLKSGDSRPPLFFIHGWGGEVYGFLELARQLDPAQPCYGIQAVGLDGKAARHRRVEEMAAHYVKEIISFQPAGPYYLIGHSLGAVFTYEIAQQLHRLGRRVALLVLLDPEIGPTSWIDNTRTNVQYFLARCSTHLRRWRTLPPGQRFDYLRGRGAALRQWMRSSPWTPVAASPLTTDGQAPPEPNSDYYLSVAASYRFQKYPGSTQVFLSEDGNTRWIGYWRFLIPAGVAIEHLPGSHMDIILSPKHATVLAQSLTELLRQKHALHNQ